MIRAGLKVGTRAGARLSSLALYQLRSSCHGGLGAAPPGSTSPAQLRTASSGRIKTQLKKALRDDDKPKPRQTRRRTPPRLEDDGEDVQQRLDTFLAADMETAVEGILTLRLPRHRLGPLLKFRQRSLLDDDFYVAKEVEGCLGRGDLNRALLVVRYAGKNGTAGMNMLLARLLSDGDAGVAEDAYKALRKLGVPANPRTYVVVAGLYDAKVSQLRGREAQVEQLVESVEVLPPKVQADADLRVALAKAVASQYDLADAVSYFMENGATTSAEVSAALTRFMHREGLAADEAAAVFDALLMVAQRAGPLDRETERAFLAFALKHTPGDAATVDKAYTVFAGDRTPGNVPTPLLADAGDWDVYLRYLLAKGRAAEVVASVQSRQEQGVAVDAAQFDSYCRAVSTAGTAADVLDAARKARKASHFVALLEGLAERPSDASVSTLNTIIDAARRFCRGTGSSTEPILYPEIMGACASAIVAILESRRDVVTTSTPENTTTTTTTTHWKDVNKALWAATGTLRRCIDEILERRNNVLESKECLVSVLRLCERARPIAQADAHAPAAVRWIDQLAKVSAELLPAARPRRADLIRAKIYFYGERDLAIALARGSSPIDAISNLEQFIRKQIVRAHRQNLRSDRIRTMW